MLDRLAMGENPMASRTVTVCLCVMERLDSDPRGEDCQRTLVGLDNNHGPEPLMNQYCWTALPAGGAGADPPSDGTQAKPAREAQPHQARSAAQNVTEGGSSASSKSTTRKQHMRSPHTPVARLTAAAAPDTGSGGRF